MKSPGLVATFLIIGWMALMIVIFIIVTVPAEGRLTAILPQFFWQLREVIYPLFYSPSIL